MHSQLSLNLFDENSLITSRRRQGVGLKLVRVGLKVAQKWGDKKLFVIVENDNIGAIKFYEKLKFSCIKKEEDSIYRRMDRAPRIFMSIDVPERVTVYKVV